jgi:hypothetical protein
MSTTEGCHVSRCPLSLSRRGFLKGVGASALAAQTGLLEFASSVLGAVEPEPAGKARILAAFARPNVDRYFMGWPGASYDIKGHQVQYTKVLKEAAKKLGADLDLTDEPIHDQKTLNAFLEKVAKTKPDGVLLTCMCLNQGWRWANQFLDKRGAVPTVVYSQMGTSFTGHLQHARKVKNAFLAATQDVEWLATGLRMLNTVWMMKNARICVLRGNKPQDRKLEVIGTTLHYIPRSRYPEVLKKVEATDEVKAVADYYAKEAEKIVEPNKEDILNAAKGYFTCRRIIEQEKCQGISIDCLGLIGSRQIPCPPCIAFSRLLDEGSIGTCEADWNAAISQRLTAYLIEQPGFMQDPAPNTVNNTLMGAHCTSATKLGGFQMPHEPFILRSHSESAMGVAPQVLWRKGQRITLMKFVGPKRIILGTGHVVRNIDTPPAGGCRTSVEVTVDGVADSRDVKGFHQLFIYGDHEVLFKAYAKLSGIEVEHI